MSRGTGGGRPRKMRDPQNVTIRLDRLLLEAMDLLKKKSPSMTFSRITSSGIRAELDQLNVKNDEVIHLLEEFWRSEIEYAENQLASLAAIKKRLENVPAPPVASTTCDIDAADDFEDQSPSLGCPYSQMYNRGREEERMKIAMRAEEEDSHA